MSIRRQTHAPARRRTHKVDAHPDDVSHSPNPDIYVGRITPPCVNAGARERTHDHDTRLAAGDQEPPRAPPLQGGRGQARRRSDAPGSPNHPCRGACRSGAFQHRLRQEGRPCRCGGSYECGRHHVRHDTGRLPFVLRSPRADDADAGSAGARWRESSSATSSTSPRRRRNCMTSPPILTRIIHTYVALRDNHL